MAFQRTEMTDCKPVIVKFASKYQAIAKQYTF